METIQLYANGTAPDIFPVTFYTTKKELRAEVNRFLYPFPPAALLILYTKEWRDALSVDRCFS